MTARISKNLLLVENFNLKYGLGARLRFWTGVRGQGPGREGILWAPAQIQCGTPVVYIRCDGKNVGSVALTHVEPMDKPIKRG